jgi:hypothetical protein
MRTSSTFKMSKSTKRMLALGTFKSKALENVFKTAMIQSQLYSSVTPRTSKSNDSDNS